MKGWKNSFFNIPEVSSYFRIRMNEAEHTRVSRRSSHGILTIWVFLALYFHPPSIQAQDPEIPRGLIFSSFDVDPSNRTSLDLSDNSNEPITEIEFDLALNGFVSFGYIFRSVTMKGSKMDFLFTPNEGGVLKIVLDGQETHLNIPIRTQEVRRNYWRKVNLKFLEGKITLTSDEQKWEHQLTGQTGINKLVFGVNDEPEIQTVDNPPFMIRDLKIGGSGTFWHHWPAGETEGELLADLIGGQKMKVTNGKWLAAQSFHWNEIGELRGEMSLIVGHDPIRQRILWVQSQEIKSLDLVNNFPSQYDFQSPIESRFGLFDSRQDQMVTFDMEPLGVSQIQLDTMARLISETINPRSPIQNLWHLASFTNPLDSNLMLLGGYGFFTSKNTLWSYDQSTERWSLIPLKGDLWTPRYHHGLSEGPKPGQFYIFGGIGNQTGKQELGLNHYYDLYLLDLNDSSVLKVWDLPAREEHFSVVNRMIFSPEDKAIYALSYPAYGESNDLILLKLSTDNPQFEIVGDSIPFVQKGFDRTQAGLFQNRKSGELIAYTLAGDGDDAIMKLYSILFPPRAVPLSGSSSNLRSIWYLFMIPLLVFFVVAFMRTKYMSTHTSRLEMKPIRETERNSFRLWGGFTVIDASGTDVSNQFSPKIKELFLLLFFNSIGGTLGIRAQKIYEKLWPGYEKPKAKNALGVTMGRLRNALQEVESVSILNENGAWVLEWKNETPTDYHLTLLCLEGLQDHFSEDVLESLISVIERGPFLPNTEIEWIDEYKGKVNYRVTSALMDISDQVGDPEMKMKIAHTILSIDDLHEQAAKLKIKSLITMGKHGLANDFFEEFSKKYQDLFQESFPLTFKEMKE